MGVPGRVKRRAARSCCAGDGSIRGSRASGMTPCACGDRRSIRSIIASAAPSPISSMDLCTVVSGGIMNAEAGTSSKPTSETSCGTLRPRRCSASIAPCAVWSFAAKTAVNSTRESSSALIAACPPDLQIVAGGDQLARERDLAGGQGGLVAIEPLQRVRMIRRPRDERDPAVPLPDQVVGREACTDRAVHVQAVNAFPIDAPAGHDQRHAARKVEEFLVRQATGQQDDAFHAPAQQVIDATSFVALAPVPADEERGVVGSQQALLDRRQRLTVERAVDGLGHDTDAHRLAAGKRACHRVRHELQLGDGGFDGPHLRFADPCGPVQDA